MRRYLLAAVGLALAAAPAPAETADEVVADYIKALGGADAIKAVKTQRRTGKLLLGPGFEAAYLQENKRPDRVRQETTMQGLTGVTAYDGRAGWKIEPWEGKKDAEPLGEDELKAVLEDADIDGPLVDYRGKGHKVEFAGREAVEGTDARKLKVTLKTGDVRVFYLDAEYHVPIKIETRRLVRGAEREYETVLGDYKRVAGVYVAHSLETNAKGSPDKTKIVFAKIEANVPVADARFAPPGSKPREAGPADEPAPAKAPPEAKGGGKAPGPARPAAVAVDSDTISGLGARNIGPAVMSGRVAALDAAHEGKRLTIYVGAASGGVWKSVNGGTTYKPVFDKQPVQSVGALAIDPKDPKTVWVGTGEAWTRNSTSVGDGVYKSTDGGETWANVGLKDSERIGKIAVDPTDSNTVYACALGKLWSDGGDRGLYKTADGGNTWKPVLTGKNPSTGCSAVALDPKHPKTVYACLWDFRRKGWTFRSGGDGPDAASGSGLFKSTDGGATWAELHEKSATGLPPKPWGRVAVAVAPSKPEVVYAVIEADPPKNGLYRSDDGGKTWAALDRSQNMVWRPFYFANLVVDPHDENKVYKPGGSLIASTDGGKSFTNIAGGHGDYHDLWVDPKNTDHLITGDDGGVWYSSDGGNKWWKADNLPVAQFYHVSVDLERPYRVYGGLQDNSTWVGASQFPGGVTNAQWENLYFGDGFWAFPDPTDPDCVYVEFQGGEIARVNRKTHETRMIKPLPHYKEGKLRFNWNTPIHLSPTQKGTIYIGSQFLHRSRDRGQTWERISPDLTTNDPEKQKQEESGGVTVDNSAAEMHTTIYAIAESPRNPDVLWAGTDDGNLQVTHDGGKTWANVVGNVKGLPKSAWVSSIEAGHFDEGTAYVTFDLHTFGDVRPYAYKTTDHGKTWTPLAAGGAVRGFAHVIKEDLVNRDLLFLGTEFGMWVSLDGGRGWAQYKGGDLPNVPVRDLAIHPRDHDLVIATHGRGIWIVDDITPLRALTPEVLTQDVVVIRAQPSTQRISASGGWMSGDAQFAGPNSPEEATVAYYQRGRHIFGDFTIEVFDESGKKLGTVPTSKRRGLSRAAWAMRLDPPKAPPGAGAAAGTSMGPRVLPGRYTVKLTKDDRTLTAALELVADPRGGHTAADRRAQFDLAVKLHALFGEMTDAVGRIDAVREALDERRAKVKAGDPLGDRLRAAVAEVDRLRKKVVASKEGGAITGEERLREYLSMLYAGVLAYDGRPTQTQVDRADALARELADVVTEFDGWTAGNLPRLNAALTAAGQAEVKPPTRGSPGPKSGSR